ncbi:ADP-ribose pyrophosphatase YjhB (NUDIX family) [Micromonospora pisi]|uniref:ADP-ribose pyrophosphatase YjhB (NUDIX family) n=1 Tax=Micromonospora pisi TaxID=589240 RepID=A0A495JH62_9ACTN|nr:NUDIX domain-containing protein [Micromonospora pisi]RKR87734.1 ADP-ribose pyrophosphatase YjhB (NUDIX family) [Micromonospora pisi]
MKPRTYGPDASFCPRCGAPLAGAPPTVCGSCGYALFVNARPTASLILLDGDPVTPRFLALRRAAEPRSGLWETPGGFCDGWEHPEVAAVREGREELGVEVTLGAFVGMYVGGYDYQGETLPVLDIFYLATIGADDKIRLDPAESSGMTWFPLADPPPLAFETMDAAVRAAARQLGL